MYSYISNLWGYLSNASKPYEGEKMQEDLDQEWDCVLGPTDEINEKCSKISKARILEEIQFLKKNLIKTRNVIIRQKCQSLFLTLSDSDRILLENVKLPNDTLVSINRKFIISAIPKWQECLNQSFSEVEKLKEMNWYESKYSKNVEGQLVSIASKSSSILHVNGLNERNLCDIMWSITLSLTTIISEFIDRRLDTTEIEGVTRLILPIIKIYLKMYTETVYSLHKTLERVGKLPEKWKKEDDEEQKRLEKIKEEGVDASFKDGFNDILEKGGRLISESDFEKIKFKINIIIKKKYNIDNTDNNEKVTIKYKGEVSDKLKLRLNLLETHFKNKL